MAAPLPRRDYQTLDAIVVVGSLLIVGCTVAGLMLLKVPTDNLPIVAGLVGTILGTVIGGYAGFRWGASVGRTQDVRVVNPPEAPAQVEEARP
jgi:hypothetical protein